MKRKLPLLAAILLVATPAFAAGDAVKGQIVFKKCQACHTVDGKNRVGPSLDGIVGRSVAALENFRYSPAMSAFAADGKVWDVQLLTDFLSAPRIAVKGTSMAFAGIKKADEIEDLIAYLANPN